MEDVAKLKKLLPKYQKIIDKYAKEYKPDVTAAFLNIKNPYTKEIESEDLLDNWKAYSSLHDGAFLLRGTNFLVSTKFDQIKTIDNESLEHQNAERYAPNFSHTSYGSNTQKAF
jgi:hypothetical protein